MTRLEVRVDVEGVALRLQEAEVRRVPIPPLTDDYPKLSPDLAYRVQTSLIERKLAKGARVVGRKIGLTSRAMQRMLKVGEPDYGHLLDNMAVGDGASVDVARLIQPKVEPEIAFIMGRDLRGPTTDSEVMLATRWIMPALEIIDSRIEGWRIKLSDTIADNASSALFVLGGRPTPLDRLDLRLVGVVLEKDGEVVETGAGGACLGHPVRAVAWLVNKLAELGGGLREGDVVLPGALTAAVDIDRAGRFTATFDHLGSVSVRLE